jgi:hypothetical protein
MEKFRINPLWAAVMYNAGTDLDSQKEIEENASKLAASLFWRYGENKASFNVLDNRGKEQSFSGDVFLISEHGTKIRNMFSGTLISKWRENGIEYSHLDTILVLDAIYDVQKAMQQITVTKSLKDYRIIDKHSSSLTESF